MLSTHSHMCPLFVFSVVYQTSWGRGCSASWNCSQGEKNVWMFIRESIFVSEVTIVVITNPLKRRALSNFFKAHVQSAMTTDRVCKLSPAECKTFFVFTRFKLVFCLCDLTEMTVIRSCWRTKGESAVFQAANADSRKCADLGRGKRDFSLGLAANLLNMLTACHLSQPHDWKLKLQRRDWQRRVMTQNWVRTMVR